MLDGHDAYEASRRVDLAPARRDPTAATRPVSWQAPGQPMLPEWDAEQAIRWAYYANVIAWRCIDLRAKTVAALPFRAGSSMPDRPGETAEHNPRSRLAQLLGPPPGGPAPKLTARRLWDWTMRQKLVTGRWGWEVEQSGSGVAALWPLVSGSLRAIPTQAGSDWFGRFEYGRREDPRRLTAEQVIYGWHPMMTDFRQPESPFQAARLDVSIAVMGDRYSYAFLKNGSVPAYVVTTTEFPSEAAREAFRDQWVSRYSGPDGAGGVHFNEVSDEGSGPVGDGIKIDSVALSQKDSQFIQQHQLSLERVAIALGCPWSMIGDASGRTYANASQEEKNFWRLTVLDDLRDLTDEVNLQLAPRLGGEVGWFDTSGVEVLQAPPKFDANGAATLVKAGIISVNEARGPFMLDPVDGGDDIAAEVTPPPPQFQLPPPNMPQLPPGDTPPQEPPRSRVPDEVAAQRRDVRRAVLHGIHSHELDQLEAMMERRFRRLFDKQARSTLSRLEAPRRGKRDDPAAQVDPAHIFDLRYWTGKTFEVADDAHTEIARAGNAKIVSKFGLGASFDIDSPLARQMIEGRANQLAGAVSETTYEQIVTALAEGAREGDSIPDLAARVQHVFDVASDSRATTIARTQVNSGFNEAAAATAESYPADVVAGKEWIATSDGRTRVEHADADGQVVGVGDSFDVGGESLDFPGDPSGDPGNVINCRCTIAHLTPDEMGERGHPISERRWPLDDAVRVVELVSKVRTA